MEKILKIIRIIIIVIPILVLGYLVDKNLVLTGHLEVSRNFQKLSPFISEFSPLERLGEVEKDENGDYYQTIIGEPVFFRLTMPRIFKTARVEVTYKSEAPVFELGAQLAPLGVNYEFKPLQNLMLENLKWEKLQEEGIILFQKNKKYEEITDFLDNLPAKNEIAVYNYDLNYNFKLPDYSPSNDTLKISQKLKGAHTFYTYIKNEPLGLVLKVEDLNNHEGPDPLVVIISKNSERVHSTTLEDDGNTSGNGQVSAEREVKINLPNLAEGAYKVEILTTDDILTSQIETKQKYLAFAGHLNLAGNAPINIYTNGHKFDFETEKSEGLQEIKINEDKLNLDTAYTPISFTLGQYKKDKINLIYLPKSNALIETDGLLTFSRETFFDPTVADLNNILDLDQEEINYILAQYELPLKFDGWSVASVNFDLSNKAISNKKLKFSLRAPGMEKGEIKIKEIKMILDKEPMTWGEFWERVCRKIGF